MVQVRLKNIHKSYGQNLIVKDLSLEIEDKEFVVLVGPSGCGKSTTLRMIAGLEEISSGDLHIGDKHMNHVLPGDRGVAMVFQDYALYPHMTVFENMAFSLRLKKMYKEEEIKSRVMEAAQMLDLEPYLERKPAALSGGQRQRVAMGRAIVKKAQVFLFDEPLSNLDAKLRTKMRGEIKRFHLQTQTTSIYVTHDQLEAMTLADRIVVMNEGVIQQAGTPMQLFENPRNLFVASFIGSPGMNMMTMVAKKKGGVVSLEDEEGKISFTLPESKAHLVDHDSKLIMGIRPSDIFVSVEGDNIPEGWKVNGKVEMVELLGKNAYVTLRVGRFECVGEIMGTSIPKIGDEVKLSFNLNHIHLFDPQTELNLLSVERGV